jgi:hypothetical protein
MADLTVLMGYDDDLRDQVSAGINRIRNLLLSVHPALERALGTDLSHRRGTRAAGPLRRPDQG